MFFLKEGDGFDVLEGMLKQNPNHWEITEKFAAIWLTDAQKVLMMPGDYTSCTQEDMDYLLSKEINNVLSQK